MADTTASSGEAQQSKALYLLQRDYIASTRLNFQHYVWKQDLKFNIHPSIKLPENPHIAEVACGTSIWAIEVAQEHPTAQISALDISLSQSPAQPWLSSKNIKLYEWDMTDANGPPPGLEGTFDLVHIRLVLLALENDIQPIIDNVIKLLKPGGYLQWDEADFAHTKVLHPDMLTDASKTSQELAPYMTKLVSSMAERSQKRWLLELPELLSTKGFKDAKRDDYEVDQTMLKFATDLILMVWDEILNEIPASAADKKPMLTQLVQGSKMDAAKGSVISVLKSVTVTIKK